MYQYDALNLADLEQVHSRERLRSYLGAVNGDLHDALQLYVWNTAVGGAFYGALQAVEIGLRNACDRELAAYFGQQWFQAQSFWNIDPQFAYDFRDAKRKLVNAGRHVTPGRVIAQYSLGFWTKLFRKGPRGAYVTSLWGPVLRGVLKNGAPTSRTLILNEIEQIRLLRNRVAHFEPLHQRNLAADLERIRRVASWISPTLESWITAYEPIGLTLMNRPTPGEQIVRGRAPWRVTKF